MLKLHLWSSVAVLGTARSPRSAEQRPARPERYSVVVIYFAVDMQTCWIQLDAKNAILNRIC